MHALCLDNIIKLILPQRLNVSPEVKLIHPLDFQLCVSASIIADASLPFAFKRQSNSLGSELHVTVIRYLVLRVKQHVYSLAQTFSL